MQFHEPHPDVLCAVVFHSRKLITTWNFLFFSLCLFLSLKSRDNSMLSPLSAAACCWFSFFFRAQTSPRAQRQAPFVSLKINYIFFSLCTIRCFAIAIMARAEQCRLQFFCRGGTRGSRKSSRAGANEPFKIICSEFSVYVCKREREWRELWHEIDRRHPLLFAIHNQDGVEESWEFFLLTLKQPQSLLFEIFSEDEAREPLWILIGEQIILPSQGQHSERVRGGREKIN